MIVNRILGKLLLTLCLLSAPKAIATKTNYEKFIYISSKNYLDSQNYQNSNTLLFRLALAKTSLVNFKAGFTSLREDHSLMQNCTNSMGNFSLGLLALITAATYPKDHDWSKLSSPKKADLNLNTCLALKVISLISIVNTCVHQFSNFTTSEPWCTIETTANFGLSLKPAIKTAISIAI